MKRVTLDNVLPADELIEAARRVGYELARISVTDREVEGTSFEIQLQRLEAEPETAVFGESRWGEAVFAVADSPLEEILGIISSGSFPSDRTHLTEGQRHQLRDAMILEAHIRENRDILVTNDEKAFVNEGRREMLEAKFSTKILTKAEFATLVEEADV